MTLIIGKDVPWNASWSGEDRCEIRNCRYAAGYPAVWQPHAPGEGKPLFAKPHMVRQRRSIAEMRCTVCGEQTPTHDRWWYPLGDWRDDWWISTEAPVHHACAMIALNRCPVLAQKFTAPIPFPPRSQILSAIVGGQEMERDFGVKTNGRRVVGHLKLGWRPRHAAAFLKHTPDRD